MAYGTVVEVEWVVEIVGTGREGMLVRARIPFFDRLFPQPLLSSERPVDGPSLSSVLFSPLASSLASSLPSALLHLCPSLMVFPGVY